MRRSARFRDLETEASADISRTVPGQHHVTARGSQPPARQTRARQRPARSSGAGAPLLAFDVDERKQRPRMLSSKVLIHPTAPPPADPRPRPRPPSLPLSLSLHDGAPQLDQHRRLSLLPPLPDPFLLSLVIRTNSLLAPLLTPSLLHGWAGCWR
ncbi:hypothetical protein VTN02DRAFT_4382 [Thermoascus thermophilus]